MPLCYVLHPKCQGLFGERNFNTASMLLFFSPLCL
uniref:Uncharacterized protein n=1 Tax=Arundo donax TaxID=35708 RepID=A0A0A9AYM3_ARUDO